MPTYPGYRPYGQIASETIVTPAGTPFTGTLTLYAAQTGPGTADAKSDATGNAIITISVTSGVAARFHVVEGGEAWVDTAGGRGKLLPNDVGTKAGPAGANGSSITGPAGPGVPAGGTTGQVLVKVSSSANDTSWVDPVAAPAALTGSGLGATATTAGTVTGTGLATAFTNNAGGVWGQRPTIFYNSATTTWPARTVPSGYSGVVIWNSETDPAAVPPPNGLDNDLWDKAS